jgi:hypothetical protein
MKSFKQILKESKEIPDTSNWTKTGPQLGSNPGGRYKDTSGKEWYLKHSKSDDHAKNENLANHLYRHLNVPVLDHQLVTHSGGKLGTASPIVKLHAFDPNNESHRKEAASHYASHAFVGNWDSIGLENDNQAMVNGKMHTVDAGGSLNYRAQGAPKGAAFGNKVGELDTFKNKDMNYTSAHVFGQMKPHEVVNSSKAVAGLKNETIHKLVHAHGPGDTNEKNTMVSKLINRKKDIIGRANDLAKQHKIEPIKDVDEES